jgi:hypothetical protein
VKDRSDIKEEQEQHQGKEIVLGKRKINIQKE